jgi:protein-disulfide isomerase
VTGVGLTLLALVIAIGASVQSSRDTTGDSAPQAPRGVVDRYAVPFGGGDSPKVVVDVYEDFMCPFCGQLEAGSAALVQEYADQGVQFRYRVISFLDRASSTRYSTRAMNAYAAVLDVAGPEVAKKFHDALYAQQPKEGSAGLSDDDLVQLAIAAGADADAVEKPIRDLAFEQWVKNATDAASRAKVTGTPTVVVDGKRLPQAGTDETLTGLRAAIEEKLS